VHQVRQNHGFELKPKAMLHSGQDSLYKAIAFIKLLKDGELHQSMSRKANCWDNAPQELLWGHMKDEIGGKIAECLTNNDVKHIVDDWINYYNYDRYQWIKFSANPRRTSFSNSSPARFPQNVA
jgi:transposase InsO family protein